MEGRSLDNSDDADNSTSIYIASSIINVAKCIATIAITPLPLA